MTVPMERQWILAVDPGDTTGWAILGYYGGQLWDSGQLPLKEMQEFINNLDPTGCKGIVYEDFRLYAHKTKQQIGSRFGAVQIIGALESYGYRNELVRVRQPARVLAIAEKWSGVKQPTNHKLSHHVDAYNHGFYHLCRIGVAKHKAENEQSS